MRDVIIIGAVALAVVVVLFQVNKPKPAESSTRAGAGYSVERLFDVDGCTVYRFEDGGYNRYFTNCEGKVEGRVSSGKTSRPDDIQTVRTH